MQKRDFLRRTVDDNKQALGDFNPLSTVLKRLFSVCYITEEEVKWGAEPRFILSLTNVAINFA